jgi:tau tubulin kinase
MNKLSPGVRFLAYKLDRCIGQGAFGAVWCALSEQTGQMVAIKFEFPHLAKSILSEESEIARDCSSIDTFPRYFGHGTANGFCYLVLENLGISVRAYQENCPGGIIPLNEVVNLGVGMIRAIRNFHDRGYVHRDIKPSNFVFRGQHDRTPCLIDFGLAKRWKDPDGTVYPPRPNVGFRGTARYASINSHDGSDLGRRDDLWSLFYMLIEFSAPPLPWKSQRDKDGVGQLKRINPARLCSGLPTGFQQIADHLSKLNFADTPDYEMMINTLNDMVDDTDLGGEMGAIMSGQYGSMALIVGPSAGSVMGSSSAVEGSWGDAPMVGEGIRGGGGETLLAEEQPPKTKGCCLLL